MQLYSNNLKYRKKTCLLNVQISSTSPVPKKVDLFFEVTRTRLVLGIDEATGDYLLGDPFNLVLVIDKGKPVLVDTFDIYPLPPQ